MYDHLNKHVNVYDFTELTNFLQDRTESIEQWLTSEGATATDAVSRLKDMLTKRSEWTAEIEDQVRETVSFIIEDLIKRGKIDGKVVAVTINELTINKIIDSPGATLTVVKRVRKQKPPRDVKLYYYLLTDPRMSFDDRIIFSLIYKYWRINKRRNRPKRAVSVKELERFTGFRAHTIIGCLLRLVSFGYIDADQTPLLTEIRGSKRMFTLKNGVTVNGFRKCAWLNDGDIKWEIFRCVLLTNKSPKQDRPAWFKTALGISRRTGFNYLKRWRNGVTDCTEGVTDCTNMA